MKAIVFIFFVIAISIRGYGQFQYIEWEWNDTTLDRQIRFWPNGSNKIVNKLIEGQLFRFQYYENGDLELMSEIVQYREIDTVMAYDPETLEGHIDRIVKSFVDVPNGEYKVYFNGGKPRMLGMYQNNTRMGTQIEYWENGNMKSISNYNSKGQKLGEYKEYYENGLLKHSGGYYIKELVRKEKCYDAETFKEFECEKKEEIECQTDNWKSYDILGNIIEN